MALAAELIHFVTMHPDAAMITLRDNGTPHMARIEICVVDGRLRATGAPTLVRTRNLRRDPRCSLFVFGPHPLWLGLETEATIVEGEVGDDLIRLLRAATASTLAAPCWPTTTSSDAIVHTQNPSIWHTPAPPSSSFTTSVC